MIKIAVVSSSFPPYSSGGVSTAQYGILSSLSKNKNFNVKGFTFSDQKCLKKTKTENILRSGTSPWVSKLIRIIFKIIFTIIDRGKKSYQTADIFSSAIGSIKTALKLKKFSPDIILISDHGAPMFFIMQFIRSQYFWVAHHNPMRFINPILGPMSIKDAKFATWIEKKCIKRCSCVISPSEYMKNIIKETHDVKENSIVIPNCIDLDFIDNVNPRDVSTVAPKEIKIFIPSAGSVIKGERYVFSIMQWINNSIKHKKVFFLLSGSISEKLNYEISQHKNINVIVLGQQQYADNIAYLKSCDLCISPCLLESFGMAILESVLSGVAVVAFDVGGNKEIIKNGSNGYLVNYLDIAELCNKSIELINKPIPKEIISKTTRNLYSLSNIEKELSSLLETWESY